MKTDNSPPRGTRDLLPAVVALRDHVLGQIASVYHRYGYQRIETPCLEDIARLVGGQGGENEKLIFKVLRRGLPDQMEQTTGLADLVDLGLRFDLTVPLTRFYGHHHADLPMPLRSFQFGPVWRAERPQKGRYRQFYQCDIDLIGEPSVLAEIELIEATTEALDVLGLTGTTVRLSDRRFLSALAHAAGLPDQAQNGFFIGLDKLDKIGWDGVRRELIDDRQLPAEVVTNALTKIENLQGLDAQKVADTVADEVPGLDDQVIADLATTTTGLDQIARERGLRWEFDPTLVRGMGYYTGQIFEVVHPQSTSSVAGGGRYDRLIGRSLGTDVPACGFSIGFERIVDLLGKAPHREAVAVLFDADVPAAEALTLARQLRTEGRTTSVIRRGGKFSAQLSRLESSGFTSFVHLRADHAPGLRPDERPLGRQTLA
ncbi:histidine--tRNA ligase [Sphaerisporangium sp. NPDC051011]|uniref:histidine--tRNA ligase n=1 Tax=Sphaerisporangium sp. NPDC051011 TaxID=3155792 RepID=UPI0033FF37E8